MKIIIMMSNILCLIGACTLTNSYLIFLYIMINCCSFVIFEFVLFIYIANLEIHFSGLRSVCRGFNGCCKQF